MNTELFIARKVIKGEREGKRVSKPIVNISVLSIILGVATMIVTIAVVTGFQQEVRNKVIAFGSHIQIFEQSEYSSQESKPVLREQDFYPSITEVEGVKHIQVFGYKPAIFQSKIDTVKYTSYKNGVAKDTFRYQKEIQGVIVKGVGADFDKSYFESKLLEGHFPNFESDSSRNLIVISKTIADRLNYQVGDKITAYFIQDAGPNPEKMVVAGIYKTGLEDFDDDIVFGDIRLIQKLNVWGIHAVLAIKDTCYDHKLLINALVKGGNLNYEYDFGYGFTPINTIPYFVDQDTLFKVVISDFPLKRTAANKPISIPDTAWIEIKVEKINDGPLVAKYDDNNFIVKEFLNEEGSHYKMDLGSRILEVKMWNSGGSEEFYVGGFEILIDKWEDLEKMDEIIAKDIKLGKDVNKSSKLKAVTIKEMHPDIFSWLDFLDTLVVIIISLMLIIAIINMGSALLVLILENTNMIGLLKAMGATNWSIRKIFMYNATYLILKGLIWGNVIGIGICLIQLYTGIIPLNPEIYYLDRAPINLDIWHIVLINMITIIICVISLMLPSYIVTKIRPIKSIKFN
ncbi:MAG: ABC transporter permease [Crocinitomicaceae bacterium]